MAGGERRGKILSELFGVAFMPARNQIPEEKPLPFNTFKTVPAFIRQLIDCLDKQTADEARRQLQLLFWKNLEFPADIDKLQLSAAEKCILKEMLSIMSFSFGYSDTLESMVSLITAASRCADTLETYCEHDETKTLETIQNAGYQPCNYAEELSMVTSPYMSGCSFDDRSYEEILESVVDSGDAQD